MMKPQQNGKKFRFGQGGPALPFCGSINFDSISQPLALAGRSKSVRVRGEEKMLVNLRKGEGSSYYHRTGQFEPLLATLLDDPSLADVPKKSTVADIDTLLGVELGSVMKLSILKMDNTTFDVAVLNTASMRELKAAIQKKVDSAEQNQLGHRCISWKHVWGNFCLTYNNEKLLNDDTMLRNFGIKNNDQLQFARHIPSREDEEHSRAKKRRFFHGFRRSISFNGTSTIGTVHSY